ncbi:MAG: ribbon-helix-helix protein, CopG family [Actinobacteria bacterium]|nr:ribbon-helix-helix protein, CopG family [Actinomycetota bacterium]
MNLRLSESATAAVKAESVRTGRSQQDIIRQAVDRYLAEPERGTAGAPNRASLRETVIPPRTPFKHDIETIQLPDGLNSLDLLDREDRI